MKTPYSTSSPERLVLILLLFFQHGPIWEVHGETSDQCPRPDEIAPCQCRTRGPTIQVRCTNSMMSRITEAMINIRKRVELVDVLILEDNNIPHLPSRAFGSVQVNRLFLENNRMNSIDRNAFAGVEEFISEIYIKEPQLQILPKDSIEFLKKLTVFSVENSLISDMPRLEGLQELQLFKIDGSKVRNLPGDSLRNLPSLRYLHISESEIVRLDIGVLEKLQHLVLANFTNNAISWIHPRAFRYMEDMTEVNLSGNKLRDAAMVGRAMRVVKTLKKLDVSRNEIADLRQGSFIDIISLEEVNLSHNRITELNRGALHRMPRLKTVDLSFNQIRSFHSDSFMDTPQVEHLYLSHNELNHVTDVSFVMDSLPKLTLLDLSHNDIREIPFGALRGYPRLQNLNLANNQISQVSREALADLPSLMELDLSANKLITDAMDGPIFDLPYLKVLRLAFNKLSKLNGKILSNLNQLQNLDVSHNGIMDLSEDAFQGIKIVQNVNMSYNNVKEIKSGTFEGLVHLKILDASHNELVALSDHLLGDQKNLEHLSFAHNQIQLVSSHLVARPNDLRVLDFTSNYILNFPEELINHLPELRELRFRQNAIQHLGRGSFQGLHKLEDIDMHDNRIEAIEDDAFKDLTDLKTLDLSLNIISTVGDTLEPLGNLMKLNLSDNYITSLPRNAFHSLTRLSSLDVSNNTIMEIGKAFVGMPELKYLDLSYNHLPIIKDGAFKNLPSLISLQLHDNSVTKIESDAFQDLYNLEIIRLTKNGLSEVRRNSFKDLTSLEELYLNDNLIETLEDRAFVDLYSMKELHLDRNLMEELNEKAFIRTPSLRSLNMSYNLLRDLPRNGFRGLETLENVDLSFNDLREIDERAFLDMRWLTHLKLNDNNICRIRANAFKDAQSLNSISLSNNRLTRIYEQSFGENNYRISRMEIAGNPLTCDCNTLWLRNLASDTNVVPDEPRCYFPRALSGNPLRQLRTSRFTCDSRAGENLIKDACSGIPLKRPIQEAIQEQTTQQNVVVTHYPDLRAPQTSDAEATIKPTTLDEVKEDDEVTHEESTNAIDVDVVEIQGDEKSGSDGELYEYYYVYYDEDGQVVSSTSSKPTTLSPPIDRVETKVQDINLEDNVSNDKVAGDTPTIYAEIKDPEDGEKSDEDDSVFSIFGIPIPKLPLNLNFALSPALSSGLLPIGRKGDNANQAPNTSSSNKAPTNQIVPPEVDQTRGPDFLDPIWVETGLKAAGFLLPKLAESFANRGTSSSSSNGAATEKRQVSKSGNSENNEMFNYQHPTNPIIPLRSGSISNQENPRYFPQDGTNEEYFPKDYIPAIQYNHPVPNGYPLPMSGHTPIHAHPNDQVSLPSNDDFNSAVPKQNIPRQTIGQRPSSGANLGFGSSQDDVNGFKPLFRPHTKDPMFSANQGQLQPGSSFQSAFPELDSPMTPLPPGFKVADASDMTDSSNKYPHLHHPSLQFTSPANNEVSSSESTSFTPISTSTVQPNNLGPSYQAVPGSFPDSSSIDRPPILNPGPLLTNLFASTNEDTSSTTLSDILEGQVKSDPNPDYEYEYVYEDVVPETKASSPIESLPGFNPPSDHVEGQAEIQRLLEEFRRQNVEEREVTERIIPTLQVQEVTTSSSSEVSTEGVEIAHRGTPKIVPETTTFNLVETEPEYTTTSSEYFDEPKDDEPEYQYYYEYYDDEEDPSSTTEVLSTSSEQPGDNILAQPQQSLDDIFNLMKQKGDFGQNTPQSKNFERPTPPPPIRTSTQLYDVNGNYLESQRSSVTVDSVSASRIQAPEVPDLDEPKSSTLSSLDGSVTRRSSSPYPFHPDRSDPASKPNRDDQPGWYYSNYNKDNVEPFRGPGADDIQHNGSSSSRLHCLNSAPVTLVSTVLLVLVPRMWGTWHV